VIVSGSVPVNVNAVKEKCCNDFKLEIADEMLPDMKLKISTVLRDDNSKKDEGIVPVKQLDDK
jgi:hypothetical protein